MRGFRELAPTMPDTVSPELVLWSIPPAPEIPEALHWSKAVFVLGVHSGPASEVGDLFAPFARLGDPIADLSATHPYVAVQSELDALIPDGTRAYMKSHFANELSDAAITTPLDHNASRPSPLSLIAVRTLGGAVAHRRTQLSPTGSVLLVEPQTEETLSERIGSVPAQLYYPGSAFLCTPNAIAQGGHGLGNQVSESTGRELFIRAGFASFRRIGDTPVNRVFEARIQP